VDMIQRANSVLLDFYSGVGTDDRGHYLKEMLQWLDAQLEEVHDYIQWMFPLAERSGFNIHAPILTVSEISEFRSNPELRKNLKASFVRILGFYGLILSGSRPLIVKRALHFGEASRNWITPGNHNHLRITRILKSLLTLGLEEEALAFYDCLDDIYRAESAKLNPGISEATLSFWQRAANVKQREGSI
jgi:Opioid growth factor receptor (OGFr) conserved region